MKETTGKTVNRRKPIPHMCITCQYYEPYHCNLYNGYIEDWDCDVITKCRAWRLSDNYKKGGKFYDMKDEGDREMKEDKYSVFIDNDKIAEHVSSLEGALVQILCEKKPKDVTTIIIAREPLREEAWEDKDYLIIMFGDGINVVKGAKSLKDAVCAINGNSFLKKPLEAFDDTEVDEIVRIYNKYNEPDIKHIYVIEEKIY